MRLKPEGPAASFSHVLKKMNTVGSIVIGCVALTQLWCQISHGEASASLGKPGRSDVRLTQSGE